MCIKNSFFRVIFVTVFIVSPFTNLMADNVSQNKINHHQVGLADTLYYIEQGDKSCSIKKMNLKNKDSSVLYTPKKCPRKLVVPTNSHILLVYKNYLQDIQLQPKLHESPEIQFPIPTIKKEASKAVIKDAGYSADNKLLIVMVSYYPWDDEDAFLYQYNSGKWIQINSKHCHRFEECNYSEIHQKPVDAYFWDEELNPWHTKQKGNPYVIKRNVSNKDPFLDKTDLIFKFEASSSKLSIGTQSGPDTGATLTMGMSLKTQSEAEQVICPNQCSAILMGKYLLVEVFWGGRTHNLYDLETGKLVKKLSHYQWGYN